MTDDKDDLLDSALTPEPFDAAFEMQNADATDASSFETFAENSISDTQADDTAPLPEMDSLLNENDVSHGKEISFGGGLGHCEIKCLREPDAYMKVVWRKSSH